MPRNEIEIFPDLHFGIVHDYDEKPNNIFFPLHNHDDIYEIVLLLNGDCEFQVEGNNYKLYPHDIFFTRPFELHHITHLSGKPYERIILYLKSEYFRQNNCAEFLDIFQNRELGHGNLIIHDIAERFLIDCMKRILNYCNQNAYNVANKIVYEFLYLINCCKNSTNHSYTNNKHVRDIIVYINDHLSENVTLDTLSENFFITKHHMCKIFKSATGYTINQYINYKRILLVQELYKSGRSLIQASMDAGFNSYANFYKAYVKQTGKSPKNM